jgi:formylglycine-generating enzyme required for sulfatase activity
MGTTISQQRDKANPSYPLYGEGDNYPMYYVSWEEVQDFITKLNAQTGMQYRLPTEAEWEYAARGGAQSAGYKYSGSNDLGAVAWYSSNSSSTSHVVGDKQENELGIHDMSGNVWEWCSDWYGAYSSSAQENPIGASSGSYRVLRGGGWISGAVYSRVAARSSDMPGSRNSDLGFRLACSSN